MLADIALKVKSRQHKALTVVIRRSLNIDSSSTSGSSLSISLRSSIGVSSAGADCGYSDWEAILLALFCGVIFPLYELPASSVDL